MQAWAQSKCHCLFLARVVFHMSGVSQISVVRCLHGYLSLWYQHVFLCLWLHHPGNLARWTILACISFFKEWAKQSTENTGKKVWNVPRPMTSTEKKQTQRWFVSKNVPKWLIHRHSKSSWRLEPRSPKCKSIFLPSGKCSFINQIKAQKLFSLEIIRKK